MLKRLIGLLDFTGNKSANPEQTKGSPGFANYGGYIEEKEKDSNVSGRQKYRTYSNLLANVAIVAAGVRYFLNLMSKADWNVSPADDSEEAQKMADLTNDIINDMDTPWRKIVKKQAMYKFYGNAMQEWTLKLRDDGNLGFLDVYSRPSHTIEQWDTDEQGKLRGILQRSPQDNEEIYVPRWKLVYSVEDSMTDLPEGLGIFRNIVETADRLRRYEQLEGFGFETDLRGTPVGRAPLVELAMKVKRGELNQTQADSIVKPLRQFVSNHIKNPKLGMLLDSSVYTSRDSQATPSSTGQWGLDLLRGNASNTQEQVAKTIERLNHEIARLIGVEHLLLGSDGRGTQALSRDKSHNFFLIIDSALAELSETFDKDIIDVIWEYNEFDPELKPSFSTEAVQFRDIEQITGAIRDLANSGDPLMPDDPIINEVRELLGLSKKDMNKALEDAMLMNPRDALIASQQEDVEPEGIEDDEE